MNLEIIHGLKNPLHSASESKINHPRFQRSHPSSRILKCKRHKSIHQVQSQILRRLHKTSYSKMTWNRNWEQVTVRWILHSWLRMEQHNRWTMNKLKVYLTDLKSTSSLRIYRCQTLDRWVEGHRHCLQLIIEEPQFSPCKEEPQFSTCKEEILYSLSNANLP